MSRIRAHKRRPAVASLAGAMACCESAEKWRQSYFSGSYRDGQRPKCKAENGLVGGNAAGARLVVEMSWR